ncbi:unnamed protein product [Ilex paraguariensis]|uniref:Uncharacterized protein n=1 Tax=Ilex paraguariensis TaxID=185542 RepID=A0ABC8TNA9_9AQUA
MAHSMILTASSYPLPFPLHKQPASINSFRLRTTPELSYIIGEQTDNMCRGFQHSERERLNIKAFYIYISAPTTHTALPDSLTLYYLPRINGSPLEIDDSKIRPDSPGFVTLHRVVSSQAVENGAVFGSRERVRASEGVRFEVYLREDKVLKGNFRKDEGDEWKMECKCGLENEIVGVEVREMEVCVAVDGQAVGMMTEKVEMVVQRKRRGRCFVGLEEIPEERELECESEGENCCCCCGEEREKASDGGDSEEGMEVEMEIEGVRWAVDVGIWVVCLGMGYLVSKASSKRLRRRRLL